MKNFIVGLLALGSISASAQSTTLERTATVISRYTPLTAKTILSSESNLDRIIADNYVAGELFGNLNEDLKSEFGKCAHGALWERADISTLLLSKAIAKQCNL